jgi:hypothetical protein
MATVYDDQKQVSAEERRLDEIDQAKKLHEAETSASKSLGQDDDDRGIQELEDYANDTESGEEGGFFRSGNDDDDTGGKHRRPKISRMGRKFWFIGGAGAGGVIMVLLVIITIFSLLGNLKDIHFATMLRTVGLARFNYVMKKQFARTIFDAAVLTDSSTGSAAKELKKANLPKQLQQLGTDGILKFDFEKGSSFGGLKKTNQFKGVVIDGKSISLDDISKGLGYKKPFNDLSRSQKRAVRAEFAEQVKFGMNDALKSEGRFFRTSALENIRKVAGIKMIKWPDKARMYLGKSPKDARKLNLDDLKKNVDASDTTPKSKLKPIQEEADQAKADAEKAVLNGESPGQVRTRWAQTLRTTTKVSTAVFLTTTACIVHDLAGSFADAKKETEMRSMRLGHDALTSGGQAVEGDVYAEAPNADGERWNNAEKSVLYKQATGETKLSKNDQQQLSDIPSVGGPASTFASIITTVDDVIFPSTVQGAIIDKLLNAIGVQRSLSDIGCDALLNEYVQYSLAGAELAVTIGSAGATEGVVAGINAAINGALVAAGTIGLGQLLGTLIDKAVASYAGLDYGATQTGEPLYNQSQVGVNMLAQTGDRKVNYGRELNDDEARDAQNVAMADVKKYISEQSFSYRYFAIDNPFSLTGTLVANAPGNFTDLGTSIRDSFSSMASVFSTPQQLFSSLGNIFMPARYALAEQGQNMTKAGDVDVFGWTSEELHRLDTEDKFTPDNIDKYFDDHADELHEKFDKCYTYDLQADKPKECTREYEATDDAIYYRAHESALVDAGQAGGIN